MDTIILCECGSCKHIWPEHLDLPMAVDAFVARIRAGSICPRCSSKKSYMLLGDRYKEAYRKLFGKDAPEGPTPFEGKDEIEQASGGFGTLGLDNVLRMFNRI